MINLREKLVSDNNQFDYHLISPERGRILTQTKFEELFMIKKYIWPYISPLLNNKKLEPHLIYFGFFIVFGCILYTLIQSFID